MKRKSFAAALMIMVLLLTMTMGVLPVSAGSFSVTANDTGRERATVKVQPGGSATMKVNVDPASGQYTYSWSRSYNSAGTYYSEPVNETSNTVVLSTVDRPYEYSCSVRDADGDYGYCSFSVSVDNSLRFDELSINGTENVWRYTAEMGEKVSIVARAEATDTQGMTYKWYMYPGNDWDSRALVPSLTGPQADITVSGSETYEVYAIDKYNNEIQSNFSILVENHFDAYDKQTGERYSDVDVTPGGSAVLEVFVTGDDLSGLTASWSNGAAVNKTNDSDGNVIISQTISSINENTSVECDLADGLGNNVRVQFYIHVNHLTVTAGSTGKDTEEIQVTPGESKQLSVTVSADNMTGLSYSWNKGHFEERGNYFESDEWLMGETGSSLTVSNIDKTTAYSCSVQDQYNNYKTVYFKLTIDNGFSVSYTDSSEGFYKYVSVPYGGSTVLEIKVNAVDTTGMEYVWKKNGASYSTGTTSISLQNVTESQDYSITVTDRYGNTGTLNFRVTIDLSDQIYAGYSDESAISGFDDIYFAKAWISSGDNLFYVTPLCTVSEANATSGLSLTGDEVYIWITFTKDGSSFEQSQFSSDCQRTGLLAGTVTQNTNGTVSYKIGVPLWKYIDPEKTYTSFYSGMSRGEKYVFQSGPASYGGLTINFSGAGAATPRNGYLEVSRSNEYSSFFTAEFDEETATLTVTPKVSYSDFIRQTGCKNGTMVGFNMGLSTDSILLEDVGKTSDGWRAVYDSNPNFSGQGDGGDWFGMGSGFAVIAWTENDVTFQAYGKDLDGEPYTLEVRLITLDGPPSVETVVADPVIDSSETNTDDTQAVQEIVQAIKDSDSLGISEALDNAVYDSANDIVDELLSGMTQDEIDSIEKFEVQSYLEVSVTELITDETEPALTLEISPKYDLVQVNKDGTEETVATKGVQVKEEVEIVLYVGDVFGSATNVVVTHVKDNGNKYTYFGTIDSDGYLRFTNPNGFSSFRIEAIEETEIATYVIVDSLVSDNVVDTESVKTDDTELLEEIVEAIEASEALGDSFYKALNNAAEKAVDAQKIRDSLSDSEKAAIDRIEVQAYVDVEIKVLTSKSEEPVFAIEITPRYRIVQVYKDKNIPDKTIEEGILEIDESVVIEIPVGDLFGDATKAVITHTKSGKSYEYKGKIENGKVCFEDPDGFSTFEIKADLTPDETPAEDDTNSPKTDDLAGMGRYIILSVISFLSLAFMFVLRRRYN